jgi:hypothetical protein
MPEAREFYLWPGTGAIADLEDGETEAEALELLKSYSGDCTLWERCRLPGAIWRPRLLAVKMGGRILQ